MLNYGIMKTWNISQYTSKVEITRNFFPPTVITVATVPLSNRKIIFLITVLAKDWIHA